MSGRTVMLIGLVTLGVGGVVGGALALGRMTADEETPPTERPPLSAPPAGARPAAPAGPGQKQADYQRKLNEGRGRR